MAVRPVSSTQSIPFSQVLDEYKLNYLNYRVTGDARYKTAYESLQQWLDKAIEEQSKRVDTNAERIGAFVQEYSTTNADLLALQKSMKEIRTQGPKLQDQLETEVRREEPVVDYTDLYVKGVVIVTLVGIALVVS